jgi:hypothetical protein
MLNKVPMYFAMRQSGGAITGIHCLLHTTVRAVLVSHVGISVKSQVRLPTTAEILC